MHRYLMWSLRRVLWRMTSARTRHELRGSGRKLHLLRQLRRFTRF